MQDSPAHASQTLLRLFSDASAAGTGSTGDTSPTLHESSSGRKHLPDAPETERRFWNVSETETDGGRTGTCFRGVKEALGESK